jgi:hypothetical protein
VLLRLHVRLGGGDGLGNATREVAKRYSIRDGALDLLRSAQLWDDLDGDPRRHQRPSNQIVHRDAPQTGAEASSRSNEGLNCAGDTSTIPTGESVDAPRPLRGRAAWGAALALGVLAVRVLR